MPARLTSPRRPLRSGAVLVMSLLLAVTAASGAQGGGRPPLVYLSGLDDHLLPTYARVPMHASPDGPVVAMAPVDSLAWVHGEVGQWLDVELVEPAGGARRGWVADFYLRGELHVVSPRAPGCPIDMLHSPGGERHGHYLDPSALVRLVDIAGQGSGTWVLVRSAQTGATSWVERAALSERPGPDIRKAERGTACEDIEAEAVVPHTH